MTKAQQARQRLKGHWAEAITVECTCIAAGTIIPIASITALRLTGIGIDSVVHASDIRSGGWMYALLTLGFMLFDWLLMSPILLGRLAFYQHITAGEQVPFYQVFQFFSKRYFHALRWRLSLFLHRFLCLLICLTPTALAAGISKVIRQNGGTAPVDDVIILMCTVVGFFLFLAGLLISEILMLRRLPAAYLLIDHQNTQYPKHLFKTSARKMRGHISETVQLITGFGGWFFACLLIIPYFYVMPLFFTTRTIAVAKLAAENKEAKPFFSRFKNKKIATQDTVELPPVNDKRQPC